MADAAGFILAAISDALAASDSTSRVAVQAEVIGGLARALVQELGREKASRVLYRLADTVATDQRVGK